MTITKYACSILIFAAVLAANANAASAKTPFGSWPAGASPEEVGRRVAARFIASPHPSWPNNPAHVSIIYPEVCAWYGALTFSRLAGEKEMTENLIKRFEPLLGNEEAWRIPPVNHVDNTVFGAIPLEIYIQTKAPVYRALGLQIADGQWDNPTPEGLTNQTRFWIDDMFMITAVQVQAYRATGAAQYIDRTAHEMVVYLDALQQPNGLFFHAPDVPFFWGRGNGWMAAGMTELLRSLPENHPSRSRIMDGYLKMMATLLQYQRADGMWCQLIDHPEAWPESSCTGMFTFAFITGVKNGWLDGEVYGLAARRGWLALTGYINGDGDIREVCEGTNKKNDLQYYLDRGRKTGDMHGQAPVLWCASALLR